MLFLLVYLKDPYWHICYSFILNFSNDFLPLNIFFEKVKDNVPKSLLANSQPISYGEQNRDALLGSWALEII